MMPMDAVRSVLAEYDEAAARCPVQHRNFDVRKPCPKCLATVNDSCRLIDLAAIMLVGSIRRIVGDNPVKRRTWYEVLEIKHVIVEKKDVEEAYISLSSQHCPGTDRYAEIHAAYLEGMASFPQR